MSGSAGCPSSPVTVFSTTDGGESWDLLKGINGVEIGTNSIFFLDDRNGWIAGWRGKAQGASSGVQFVKYLTDGMVARTMDGGSTWTRHDSDTGRFLWDVVFFDTIEGWAVGSFGTTMYSEDGGVTWESRPTPNRVTPAFSYLSRAETTAGQSATTALC